MSKEKDHTGRRFGRLTVISKTDRLSSGVKKSYFWECLCDCGNVCYVLSKNFGTTKSCGCLKREMGSRGYIQDENWEYLAAIRGINEFIRSYKESATGRNQEYSLTLEYLLSIIVLPCLWCHRPPMRQIRLYTGEIIKVHGLDRCNNKVGYVMGNVISSCTRCNMMRGSLSIGDFLLAVQEIARAQNLCP